MTYLNNPSRKPIISIAVVTAVCLLGNEMLFIVMPLYWKFFGLTSLWQVGMLLSANRIIRIPLNPLVGWCYERFGNRLCIMVAVVLAAASTFSYGIVKGFWLLLFARCMWGIAWSLFRIGGYLTILSSSNSKTRGQYVGLYNGLWGLGTLIGMLVGGVLADLIGIQTATNLFGVLAACSILIVFRFIENTKERGPIRLMKKTKDFSIWQNKRIVSALVTGLLVAFVVYGVFASSLSKLIELQLNKNVLILGISIGAGSLTGFIQALRTGWDPFLAPYLGRKADQKWGRLPILIIAIFAAAFCLGLLPVKLPMVLFIALLLLFQLVTTILITMSDSIAADLAEGHYQVTVISFYTFFSDIGAALGPLVGFAMIDVFGIQSLYWLTSIIIIPLAVHWFIIIKREGSMAVLMKKQ
ncbi:MFS transporter [Neobacillus niacini]|uniref:MFS transporter n=1 Tax=Neobacillus niacini TaxID=86668 RepID=UPI00068C582B|nr:MFS transporter [Neobacillus niacini]MEC1525924.1 MFS transporter [Neobacillus niacini]MEC1526256.1 MFS transporter [Neobacillus niacini]